jgi:uncharacterized protein (TIRG00374 family)
MMKASQIICFPQVMGVKLNPIKMSPDMTKKPSNYRLITIATLVGFFLIGGLVFYFNSQKVIDVIQQADWKHTILAVLFTAVTLFFQSYAYVLSNRMSGVDAKFGRLFEIGFVSISLNNIVSVPLGLGEHSIRAALLVPQGHRFGDVATASVFYSYTKDTIFLIAATLVLLFQVLTRSLTPTLFRISTALILLDAVLLLVAAAVFFSPKFRKLGFTALGKAWRFITRRSAEKQLQDMQSSLEKIEVVLRTRPRAGAGLIITLLCYWVSTIMVFYWCLHALGVAIPLAPMIGAFLMGKAAGILSFVPGGAGVWEVSTAGALALFGVDFTIALLVVLLFRTIYGFIPYLFSFLFLGKLIKDEII